MSRRLLAWSSSFPLTVALLSLGSFLGFLACEATGADAAAEDANDEGDGGGNDLASDEDQIAGDTSSGGGAPGNGGAGGVELDIAETLPPGFTANVTRDGQPQAFGGWKWVAPLGEGDQADSKTCGNVLRVVVRDMQDSHPDFGGGGGDDKNIVQERLGSDRKPVFKDSPRVTGFDDWYRNVDGVNLPFVVDLWLEPDGETFVFDSSLFFPLDGVGYEEESWGEDGKPHRFLFTTELHTRFRYNGGEEFLFRGDDDVFVFVDGRLVVNLGGIHTPQEGSVSLDAVARELGLETGQSYDFDLFQAERNPGGSNFRIETTLDFTGCSEILPGDVVK